MSFVVQRFHPRIRPDLNLSASGSKLPIHSQQSSWDSTCALHCAAMVLQILGLVVDPSGIPESKRKVDAMLWKRVQLHFLEGMAFCKLAEFVADIDGIRTKVLEYCSHRKAVEFIESEMASKHLVICSFREVGTALSHAVLAIGIEGTLNGRRLDAHALLLLDPAEAPPQAMATCNARIDIKCKRSGKLSRYARYTAASTTFSVVLNGAVSIRLDCSMRPP